MSRKNKGLLSYRGYEDDDDYHLPSKQNEKSRSQRYDELTRELQTGNREYGLHYPESSLKSPDQTGSQSNFDLLTGLPKPRRAGVSKGEGSRTGTPNFGRRALITGAKNGYEESERGDSPPLARKRATPRLMNISDPNRAGEKANGYKDIQQNYLSSKMADTLKLSDIAQIDLVLTLNDKTKVVVKAAPFKPYQF